MLAVVGIGVAWVVERMNWVAGAIAAGVVDVKSLWDVPYTFQPHANT